MKNLKILFLLAVTAITFITSCGGDDDPKKEMVLQGQVVSLEDANFYLAYSGDYYTGGTRGEGTPSHKYHDVVITDGTLDMSTNAYNHWYSENYTNATYIIVIEILIPNDASFEGGGFPQQVSWDIVALDAQVSWIEAKILGDNYQYVYTETNGGVDLFANGGWDDGDNMTVKFNADDLYDSELDESGATLEIFFSGTLDENKYIPQ